MNASDIVERSRTTEPVLEAIARHEDATEDGAPVSDVIGDVLQQTANATAAEACEAIVALSHVGKIYQPSRSTLKLFRPIRADGSGRVDGELLDAVQQLMLDHQGPENTISSGTIADLLGIDDAEGNPKTREALRILTEDRNVPIASTSNGYYLIQTEDHLEHYLSNLDSRIQGIQDRKQMVADAWDGHREGLAERRGESA